MTLVSLLTLLFFSLCAAVYKPLELYELLSIVEEGRTATGSTYERLELFNILPIEDDEREATRVTNFFRCLRALGYPSETIVGVESNGSLVTINNCLTHNSTTLERIGTHCYFAYIDDLSFISMFYTEIPDYIDVIGTLENIVLQPTLIPPVPTLSKNNPPKIDNTSRPWVLLKELFKE